MKLITIILYFVTTSVMALAQTSGGEIVRKPNNGQKRVEKVPELLPYNQNNRIVRTIDGITLCLSTKNDVIKYLKNRGRKYTIAEHEDNLTIVISNGDIVYNGFKWAAIAYNLYNNVVYQISYLGGDDKTNNLVSFQKMRDYYMNLYGNYHESFPDGERFSDKFTYLIILGEPYYNFSLHFADAKLYEYMVKNVYKNK